MCKHGDTVRVMIAHNKVVDVDRCLAPLVMALNLSGFPTRSSCCGHGFRPGNIALQDGRELHIAANFKEGRRMDRSFPLDIHGNVYPDYATETGEERDVAKAISETYAIESDWHLRVRQAKAAIHVLIGRGWRRPGIDGT